MSLSNSLRVAVAALLSLPLLAADSALLRMVPPEAKTVAGIDLGRSTASPFGQFLLGRMQVEDQSFRDFVVATGFDPRRDLREVIAVSLDPGEAHGSGLLLMRGVFDIPRILALGAKHGAETTQVDGIHLLGRAAKASDKGGWVALIDSSTAAAGSEDMVRAALALRKNPSPLDAKLAGRINDYSARYDAWVISTVPLNKFAADVPDKQMSGAMKGNMVQSVEQVIGGVRFGEMIEVAGEAITRSEKDAQALVDVVKFLTGMVQLNREKQPDAERFAKLLELLTVKTSGVSVLLNLSVPEADMEQLINDKTHRKTQGRASL